VCGQSDIQGAMARLGAYVLLTVLAVVPSLAYRAVLDEPDVLAPFFSQISSFSSSNAGEDARDAPANDGTLYFSIQTKKGDTPKCADIDDNENVVMADCEEGSTNQLWTSEDTVIKHYSGKCMEVCVRNCHYRFLGRRRVWIKDCTGVAAQQWTSIKGCGIKSAQNGDCLDVCSSMTCSPIGDVITYECHGEENQQWTLILGGYTAPPATTEVRGLVDLAAEVQK